VHGAYELGDEQLRQLTAGLWQFEHVQPHTPSGHRTSRARDQQLYNEAREMGIDGRTKMNKEQLRPAVDRRTC